MRNPLRSLSAGSSIRLILLASLYPTTPTEASKTSRSFVILQKRNEPYISDQLIGLIKARAAETSNDTWVSGTFTEALLEFDYPNLTVFSPSIYPLSASANVSGTSYPVETNEIIDSWTSKRPSNANEFAVIPDGAAADPAALGWAWIIASQTEPAQSPSKSYDSMIQQEITYLNSLPTTSDGAMSMRPGSEAVQLWADFIYMVPPFLAGRGLQQNNSALLLEAYTQIKLYRKYLQDPQTKLWKHIVLGTWQDDKIWGTGNAWAAAGMLRVLSSMLNAPGAYQYVSQIQDLADWIAEILTAAFARLDINGLIPNYWFTSSFSDSAASALLASVPFRMAELGLGNMTHVKTAVGIRDVVISRIDTGSGWLQNCVDPIKWNLQTDQSPEAQSFVLLMEAAYRAVDGVDVFNLIP